MYATVQVDVGAPERRLMLPQTAITYNPYGATVFIVVPGAKPDAQGKTLPIAQQVFVTPGPTRGDQVAIDKGVKEGDEVVTSGQIKLKNGTPLVINNTIQPADSPNPTPQEH
jgi:membrane fusion protein (multidrug efflux system)